MILMIDNYCSFTYNIVQYFGRLGQKTIVWRNNEYSTDNIIALAPHAIILGPGPCTPNEAGISLDIINEIGIKQRAHIPILGVCLGHQAIGQAFGGTVAKAASVMHGRVSKIHHTHTDVFYNLPSPFNATRYHSLVIEKTTLPPCLSVTAWTTKLGKMDEIMGIKHQHLDIHGVQFHPESILSEYGYPLLNNFLAMYGLSKTTNDDLPSTGSFNIA